jgi:uncharacterized protein (TIGR02679 family)
MSRKNSQQPDDRLKRLLGGVELASLRQRLRRHFERQSGDILRGALQLTNLAPVEQEALSLLTGRPPRSTRSLRIDIDPLDASLKNAGIAGSLREALELLDGPIENRAAIKQARLMRWSRLTGADHWHPSLRVWLQTPAATGLLKRLARRDPDAAEQLLARADTVMRRLPADGVTRAQLAAEAFGNAHALDNSQSTSTLVLSVLRLDETGGIAPGEEDEESLEVHKPSERARDIWARAGVLVNELARPALFLNLPRPSQETIRWMPGEPDYLPLRNLLRARPDWAVADVTIYVCENPNIVAIAADRLGARCAPLVCTEGMPAAAQRTLLNQLTQAGAQLRYHGDFDWPGVRIANYVMRTWHAHPWRFGTSDYKAAAMNAPHTQRDLADTPVIASWDAALTSTMQQHGLSIAEEAVAGSLLKDLGQE